MTPEIGIGSFVASDDFADVDELAMAARGWDLDFRKLNRGGFHGSFIQAGTPMFQIGRSRLQGVLHQRGSTPTGLRTVAIPTERDINLQWRGYEVESDCALVFPESREFESISNPDFDMLLVSVTEADLEDARHRLGIPGSEQLMAGADMVCCVGPSIGLLRRWILRSLGAVVEHPALLDDFEQVERSRIEVSDLIVQAMVTGHCEHEHHRSVRRRRLVEHAIRLARDDAQNVLSVAELSRESGASTRTLRRGFQERFGVSPKAYLHAQRLIGVRRELSFAMQPKTLISDVANSWGFWHMGQFAADYRVMFGELPSQTLVGTIAVG